MAKKNSISSINSPDSFSIIDIYNSIYKIKSKLDKFQRKKIIGLNLTLTQYCVLRQLWKTNGRTFKQLASGCHCSSSTLTGVIDTMEKKGLVKRELNTSDRRSILVKSTKEGQKLQQLTSPFDSTLDKIFKSLEAKEIQQLGLLLQKLNKNLNFRKIQ